MINHIYGNGPWLSVTQQGTAIPYIDTTQTMSGMLRLNPKMNRIEVYDGQNWQSLGGDANVDLSENTKEVLIWAKTKMQHERQLESLMERHPGLKDLHDKFQIMKVLCQEEENKQ